MAASITLLEYLQQRSGGQAFPVGLLNPDSLDEEPQDARLLEGDVDRRTIGETQTRPRDAVSNVLEDKDIPKCRQESPFHYFLDGCRRAYYICDIATPDGIMVPILAGQYSTAIIGRDAADGHPSLQEYKRKVALLLPVGGCGLPNDDADEISRVVEESFGHLSLRVEKVRAQNEDNLKLNSLAYLNKVMQQMEVDRLEALTACGLLGPERVAVVDGALQFENIKVDRRYLLKYAVGIAKRFKLSLSGVSGKSIQIGTHVLKLKKVGDRTTAFRTREKDRRAYVFWYVRIQPIEKMLFPYAGVVKIEKALVEEEELNYGLPADVIDNISRHVMQERTVNPYGLDHRWASHLYPIYLTEQIQKQKFLSDHMFSTMLARKVVQQ